MSVKSRNAIPNHLAAAGALIFAAGGLCTSGKAASAAETVRIETRPFYGATVTLEEGVRVFRPLPADRRVIINPHGRTPLSLGFEDNRTVSRNYNYSYSQDADEDEDGDSGSADSAAVGSLVSPDLNGVLDRHRGASGALIGRPTMKRHYGAMKRRSAGR